MYLDVASIEVVPVMHGLVPTIKKSSLFLSIVCLQAPEIVDLVPRGTRTK